LDIAGNVPTATSAYKFYATGNGYGALVTCCTPSEGPDSTLYNPYSLIPGGGIADKAHDTAQGWREGTFETVANDGTGFRQLGGYWEATLKLPASLSGTWPAWWMVSGFCPSNNCSNGSNELDILESFGDCGPGHNAIAFTVQEWNPAQIDSTQPSQNAMLPNGGDVSTDYHQYGVLWSSHSIQLYIDRILVYTLSPTPVNYLTRPMWAIIDNEHQPQCGGGYSDPSELDIKRIDIWPMPDYNGKPF
jgi:hypothetical protein